MTLSGSSGRGPRKCHLQPLGDAGSRTRPNRLYPHRTDCVCSYAPCPLGSPSWRAHARVHPNRLRLFSPNQSLAPERLGLR